MSTMLHQDTFPMGKTSSEFNDIKPHLDEPGVLQMPRKDGTSNSSCAQIWSPFSAEINVGL